MKGPRLTERGFRRLGRNQVGRQLEFRFGSCSPGRLAVTRLQGRSGKGRGPSWQAQFIIAWQAGSVSLRRPKLDSLSFPLESKLKVHKAKRLLTGGTRTVYSRPFLLFRVWPAVSSLSLQRCFLSKPTRKSAGDTSDLNGEATNQAMLKMQEAAVGGVQPEVLHFEIMYVSQRNVSQNKSCTQVAASQNEPLCRACLGEGILSRFRNTVRLRQLILPGDKVLAAVSGGEAQKETCKKTLTSIFHPCYNAIAHSAGAASQTMLYCLLQIQNTNPARADRGKVPCSANQVLGCRSHAEAAADHHHCLCRCHSSSRQYMWMRLRSRLRVIQARPHCRLHRCQGVSLPINDWIKTARKRPALRSLTKSSPSDCIRYTSASLA